MADLNDPSSWLALFDGVDMGVMLGIGVIAVFLELERTISMRVAILSPLILGGLWGMVVGLSADTAGAMGVIQAVMRGVIVNGAVALIAGRAVAAAIRARKLINGGPGSPGAK